MRFKRSKGFLYPRERLREHGAGALTDGELLAIFLRTGIPGTNVLDLANELLRQLGGLGKLLQAPAERLLELPGIGPAKCAQLLAALELTQRGLAAPLQRQACFAQPKAVARFLQTWLSGKVHETFACLFLDQQHRLIAAEELFQGTINHAPVHPRELVRRTLAHNAAAVIFAHNHPSGAREPSLADITITQRLRDTLTTIEVRVLDHFIIGAGEPLSMAERGLL